MKEENTMRSTKRTYTCSHANYRTDTHVLRGGRVRGFENNPGAFFIAWNSALRLSGRSQVRSLKARSWVSSLHCPSLTCGIGDGLRVRNWFLLKRKYFYNEERYIYRFESPLCEPHLCLIAIEPPSRQGRNSGHFFCRKLAPSMLLKIWFMG